MADRRARSSCALPIHANGASRNARAETGISLPPIHRNARIPPRQRRERAPVSTHVDRITRCMQSTVAHGAMPPERRPARSRADERHARK